MKTDLIPTTFLADLYDGEDTFAEVHKAIREIRRLFAGRYGVREVALRVVLSPDGMDQFLAGVPREWRVRTQDLAGGRFRLEDATVVCSVTQDPRRVKIEVMGAA